MCNRLLSVLIIFTTKACFVEGTANEYDKSISVVRQYYGCKNVSLVTAFVCWGAGEYNIIVQDPRAARPYLFSDGRNMYNRVVLWTIH